MLPSWSHGATRSKLPKPKKDGPEAPATLHAVHEARSGGYKISAGPQGKDREEVGPPLRAYFGEGRLQPGQHRSRLALLQQPILTEAVVRVDDVERGRVNGEQRRDAAAACE